MTGSSSVGILVVDDDVANRTLVGAILARAPNEQIRGATRFEAGTLGDARRILDGEPIDLLLLDVHLPDGLGLDFATELQRKPARPAILALTASVLPADQQAALDAGCDAFLAKPYQAGDLLTTVGRLLAGRDGAEPAVGG